MAEREVKTIDLTPTWSGLIRLMLTGYVAMTKQGKDTRGLEEEFFKMALAADNFNEMLMDETVVYMVSLDDTTVEQDVSGIDWKTCDDKIFIAEAIRQSADAQRVFTEEEFQEAFNMDKLGMYSCYVRFVIRRKEEGSHA